MAFNAPFQPNGHPFPETLPVSDRPHNPATELESCKAIPASGEVLQSTEQLKFEVMLGELLTKFINLPASQLDAHILEAQKRICETLGLDRSSLAQQNVEGDDIIVTHRWVADGSDDSRPLSTRDIPWLARKLRGGKWCVLRGSTICRRKPQMTRRLSAKVESNRLCYFLSLRRGRCWADWVSHRVESNANGLNPS